MSFSTAFDRPPVATTFLSQALILFTTPVIYLGFDRLARLTRRRFGRRFNSESPAE